MAKLTAAGAALALAGIVLLFGLQHGRLLPSDDADTPPAAALAGMTAQPGKSGAADARKTGEPPQWRSLSAAQQLALQPLQAEWKQMDAVRKRKWLQLANRFAAMPPEERQRVHARMREWARLTPAQRELARDTYARARKIAPAQKTASWASYQQLPDEQKKKLAASAGRTPVPAPPSQAAKLVVPLGQGLAGCPAGSVRNSISATPPCVAAPAARPQPAMPAPQPAPTVTPPKPPEPEKPVPANWGITPNNA